MGDGADYLMEMEMLDMVDYDVFEVKTLEETIEERCDDDIWTMRDGSTIPIARMSDTHIKNSLNMITRRGLKHLQFYIILFHEELERRGYDSQR